MNYVMPRREATFVVVPAGERPAREVKLIAEPRPRQSACSISSWGSARSLGSWSCSARRGWSGRVPGPMTWGFFVYVIQFNPGQAFQFWAWIQLWPCGASGAGRHFPGDAGRRLYRAPRVCAQGAGRPGRGPMADDRARSAGSGDRVPLGRAPEHGNASSATAPKFGREACCSSVLRSAPPRSRSCSDAGVTSRRATISASAG